MPPVIPAVAASPVPPPIAQVAFVDMRNNGFLTPAGLEFLQFLWAGVFGGGGVFDAEFVLAVTKSTINAAIDAKLSQFLQDPNPTIGRISALEARIRQLELGLPQPPPAQSPRTSPSPVAWVPTIAGSTVAGAQTYSVQEGLYVEIGPLIVAQFSLTMTAKDAATAGNVQIAGLPFPSNALANFASGVAWARWGNLTLAAGATQLTGSIAPNSSVIDIGQSTSAAATAPLASATGLAATSDIAGTVAYLR